MDGLDIITLKHATFTFAQPKRHDQIALQTFFFPVITVIIHVARGSEWCTTNNSCMLKKVWNAKTEGQGARLKNVEYNYLTMFTCSCLLNQNLSLPELGGCCEHL